MLRGAEYNKIPMNSEDSHFIFFSHSSVSFAYRIGNTILCNRFTRQRSNLVYAELVDFVKNLCSICITSNGLTH